jgi:hypothetical protein
MVTVLIGCTVAGIAQAEIRRADFTVRYYVLPLNNGPM